MKQFSIFTVALLLGAFIIPVSAEEREVTPEQLEAIQNGGDGEQTARPAKLPDLTKGDKMPGGKGAPPVWTLGPTGIVSQLAGGVKGDQILVHGAIKGSPSAGSVLPGDIILGVNGRKFSAGGNMGVSIGNAIIEAEKEENAGAISFIVWRDKNHIARSGKQDVTNVDIDKLFSEAQDDKSLYDWKPEKEKTEEVKKLGYDKFPLDVVHLEIKLKLRTFPAYADTAPYDCPKTKQILEEAWKVLEAKFNPDPKTGKPGRGGVVEAIALISSGKPEHRKMVHDWVHGPNSPWKPPTEPIGEMFKPDYKGHKGYQSWHHGFTGLYCAIYYETTGDEFVLPALRKFAIDTAMGQSFAGTWGHTFAYPSFNGGKLHQMNPGYGALNAAGNRCFFLITLAQKLGIKHPEIDQAVERSRRFFSSYIDQGCIPYGDHGAYGSDDSNGKNTGVAFSLKLLGDNYGAKYFSMMSSHCAFTRRGGHGHDYHGNWSSWGATLCGPEVRTLNERNLRWYRTLCRLHDGSFIYNSPTNYNNGLRDPTATEVLHQSVIFKQTLITGKDANPELYPTKREMKQLLASARAQFNDPTLIAKSGTPWAERTTDEIFDLLDIFYPKARASFAAELGKRFLAGEKEIAPRLIALLKSDSARFRDGAVRALGACGADTVLGTLSAITKLLEDPQDFVRIAAVGVISKATENEETQLAMLNASVANQTAVAPNSVRNAIQTGLFPKDGKFGKSPFGAGLDEALVERALQNLIIEDTGGGPFVQSKLAAWDKDTVVRLAGPLVYIAEQEQIVDQMFGARSAPAQAMLGKFGYLEALQTSAYRVKEKAAIHRSVRPLVSYKDPLLNPESIKKNPAVFHEFIVPLKTVLIDNPAEAVVINDDSTGWKAITTDLDDLLPLIESAKNSAPLPSIAADVRKMFRAKLDAAEGNGAKLKLCRETLKDPASKFTFRMMAAMDFLAESLLGPDAVADLVPYLGHDYWRLRDHSRKLAAQLAASGAEEQLADLFASTSNFANAAGILDVFAMGKTKTGLAVSKKAMKHESPLVRQAAVKAAFALGGDSVLTEILAHLKQAATPEDLQGCEDALLSRRAEPAHAARVRDAVIAMLPGASASVSPTLHWLLAQFGDPQSLAALAKLARTEDTTLLKEIASAVSYSPSREADKLLLDIAASGKTAAGIAGAQSSRRMVIGPKGYGDTTTAARMDFAEAMLNQVLDLKLIDYLGHIHEPRALRTLASCLRKGVASAAESLISSAEGMQKLPPADAEIAAKALQDAIEYIEITRLRGGMQAHMGKDDNYVGWKALQARAGKALLKIHKPGTAPIPSFDPLEFER